MGEAWTKYAWAESESGYYRCEATNGYTSDVAYFYLVVEGENGFLRDSDSTPLSHGEKTSLIFVRK